MYYIKHTHDWDPTKAPAPEKAYVKAERNILNVDPAWPMSIEDWQKRTEAAVNKPYEESFRKAEIASQSTNPYSAARTDTPVHPMGARGELSAGLGVLLDIL